jgi:hypothetical protein
LLSVWFFYCFIYWVHVFYMQTQPGI